MGKLLALELFNFKSYKGHHVLQFGDSYFTSIIGPNGSGKSNSMDAISFVLGIKSSHLRSTHLKDLVYRGRVLKHSKINADGTATDGLNGNANGDAEAGASDDEDGETQSSTQRNDPQTAWVMAVYEDAAGDVHRWKRSITSAGQSEYRINNRVVTAKTYNEALEAENILIKARNFLVFQGDVEAIASQNAHDLTRLIEQISGSLEYKSEYERLKAEKERADLEQTERLHQRRGINGEIKQYQQQKEELDRYEATRDEKDQAIVTHVLWKLFHFQRTIEDSTAEIQKHHEELKEFRRNVKKFEDRLEEAKRDQAKVGRDIQKYEREIKRKEKSVEDEENKLIPIDEKLNIINSKISDQQKVIENITHQHASEQAVAQKMQKDLANVQKAQKRSEDDWRTQQQKAGRELSEQDLQEYQKLRGEVYKRSGGDQAKAEHLSRQLKTDEATVKSLKSKLESTQAEVDRLTTEIAELTKRRDEVNISYKSTSKEVSVKKKAINELSSERVRTTQKLHELQDKHVEVLKKLRDAADTQRESRREANQRETVAELKRIFPGVRGMVHQLCKPKQKKFEAAVVTALGRHWDSIVVDSEKSARDCVQYLKDQRISQMTFLPLDTIVHTQANANLRGVHAGTRLAIDTIDFDTSVERAMTSACGNALVCDTLKIARQVCYDLKVDAKAVVLDGTVIHKGGNMTGGSEPSDKKRRFEETEVENLRALEAKFKADIDALPKPQRRQAELEQLESELTGLETKLRYSEDERKGLERNIESKTKELKFARGQLNDVNVKYAEQSSGLETLRQSLEQYTNAIASVEDQVFDAFCKRLGYRDIREYEQQQGSLQQEAAAKKQEFIAQISRLQNQASFAAQKAQASENRIKALKDKIKQDSASIAEYNAAKEEIQAKLDQLNGEIEQLNEHLNELRGQNDQRGEKVNEARRELQKRSKSVEKTLKDVSALEANLSTASTGRYSALRTCKLENINLPLEAGSRKLDSLPLEDVVLDEEDDEDAMDIDGETRGPVIKDYGIQIDFSKLEDELQEDDSEECETTLVEAINTLQAALDKMAPNMRSAERLDQTSERLRATEREFNDSRRAARDAANAFERVKTKRMSHFNKAYLHISEQIGSVYRDLTKTASFPLGGQASLDIEDENEPYLSGVKYHAMPPLKRFRDMEHLSGGEKTMAALALLFAIHTYAPSPFFVLDEVDAALDNANTGQLAQYVRDHAGPGMQFVVISLKPGFFEKSEGLVGVMRDQTQNSSRPLTLDLRKYLAV
ncbi:Hypothetical protein R9X50_00085400 [Acrodontium crateriforme]|uniref:Structural maintenance of chromosomes protein n=1 Tax=Acrodontium crateriforme TaxID=150365 RepID=A0AAQ3LZM2_9PEZI|nr:Hypothetical protein R9X50_00085400 [Acrodontium crateriforme]